MNQEDRDFLRDLAERLRRIPVMYGVDEGDVDTLYSMTAEAAPEQDPVSDTRDVLSFSTTSTTGEGLHLHAEGVTLRVLPADLDRLLLLTWSILPSSGRQLLAMGLVQDLPGVVERLRNAGLEPLNDEVCLHCGGTNLDDEGYDYVVRLRR